MESGNQFDMQCPSCGKDDGVAVVAQIWVLLTEDGTDPMADGLPGYDHEWEDTTSAFCVRCGHMGTAKDFNKE